MALSASTNLPHSVDRVTAVFVNEDFLRHTSELVGGTLESFAVDGDTAGAFSTTTVRTIPTDPDAGHCPEVRRRKPQGDAARDAGTPPLPTAPG